MKTAMVFPDGEKATRLLLATLFPPPATTVKIGVPSTWTASSARHLQVGWDGTLTPAHRLRSRQLIRVTAWAHATDDAKALAAEAEARLCAYTGTVIRSVRLAQPMFPARDPESRAELASFSVYVTVRSTSLA